PRASSTCPSLPRSCAIGRKGRPALPSRRKALRVSGGTILSWAGLAIRPTATGNGCVMASSGETVPHGARTRDVRMRGFQDRTEVADAVAVLDARLSPLPSESVNLHEAAGRVLAADVVAEVAVPAFDR